MTRFMLTIAALAVAGTAAAKLPPPDEAAKAKAAEAAARTAWQAKLDAFQLCKAQDRVVAGYRKAHPQGPKLAASTPVAATTSAGPAPVAGTAPSTPTTTAPAAAPTTTPTPASASQGGGTPVAAVTPAAAAAPNACSDPGPFAYTPAEQKPLEASGAHSPTGTAISPPSVRPNAAEMTPSKPSVATKK